MVSKLLSAATLASLLLTSAASATTLTVTPDKSTYLVGETITLSVFGDAEGATGGSVVGSILFDPSLASWLLSNQAPLTSFDGAVTWTQGSLTGGSGFGRAFNQLVSPSPVWPIDDALTASVVLQATAPGTLTLSWDAGSLVFFGLTNGSGASVSIVPEPSTGLLVGIGVLTLAAARTGYGRERRLGDKR